MAPSRAAGDTTATWQSETSGDWADPSQWSTNPNYPNNGNPTGVNYQALINATGGTPYTVTLDSDVAVDALTLDSPDVTLQHTSGTLTLDTLNVTAGIYQLNGGTIAGATINIGSPGQFQVNTGTLNGATVSGGDLQVATKLCVQNGLTVSNHNLDMATYSELEFDGPSQTIDNLNISVVGNYWSNIYASGPNSSGPQTLTLGPNVTVHGGGQFQNYHSGDTLINNGTINADKPSGPTLIVLDNFTNNATAEATNNGTLSITSPTWSSTGGATLSVNHATLNLAGSWTNAGAISAANAGTINLGGTFNTAQIASLSASSDSTVNITGSLDNSGATLSSGNSGGTWYLANGGTVTGGTIDASAGNFTVQNGTLNGVTVSGGTLMVSRTLCVQNGLTMNNNNVETVGTNGALVFDGPGQTIDNLSISVGGWANIYASGPSSNGPQTLTLGPSVTVYGGAQFLNYNAGDTVINNGWILTNGSYFATQINVDNFTNNGQMQANYGTIYIGSKNFTNNGAMYLYQGQIMTANGLNVGQGALGGSGAIYGNVTLSSDPSFLEFQIGGENQGTDYDSLTIHGNMTLGGYLVLLMSNGFLPSSTDTFEVLSVDGSHTLGGAFLNVADGGRVETFDGLGSFEVLYGSGLYANEIVLTDFEAVPEPASAVLLVGGCALGALRRPRRIKA